MDEGLKEFIGYRLKMCRLMRGFTQQDIADKLNKTTNAISNWERGNTSPPVDDLVMLCNLYNITPNQFYGWDDCPELNDYIATHDDVLVQIERLKQEKNDIEKRIKAYSKMIDRKH